MSQAKEPVYFFQRILVPVARPDTAMQMLQLATSLVDPENGEVIAVTVGINDESEKTTERLEALEPIVAEFDNVELVATLATSVTRGILDSVREQSADALIMGVYRSDRREVELGSLVENIVQAAPCNVLVYRTGDRDSFKRVIVPLDDNRMTMRALKIGVMLADSYSASLSTPYIQRDYTSSREKEERFRQTIDVLPDHQIEDRAYITGRSPGESLLTTLKGDDMLVIGFSQKADLDIEFGRDLSDTLLRRAPGAVLLYSQFFQEHDSVTGIVQRFLQRFDPAITQVERNELVWGARKSALSSIDFNWLIMMSAGLATLGLMLNNVAVIIGAMLVAPLMSPLGALATGLAVGDLTVTRRATLTLLQGVCLAIGISVLLGVLLPLQSPTAEMLSRGTPSLIDAAVALVSGLVAAFALARKEIPAALAGVAIAAALMPPVCTIGLGLALGNQRLAIGATLLFVTNITFIVAAENIVFIWMGLRPRANRNSRTGIFVWWGVIAAILVTVVSAILFLSREASEESNIEDALLQRLTAAEFVSIEERVRDDGTLSVLFTVRSPDDITPQRVSDLEALLEDEFDKDIALDIVNLRVIEARTQREEAVLAALQAQFPDTRIPEVAIQTIANGDNSDDDNETAATEIAIASILVDATIRSPYPITLADIRAAEAALNRLFEERIHLTVVVETVLNAPSPTPIPSATSPVPRPPDT